MNKVFKENLKRWGTILIVLIVFFCVIGIMIKYNYEGEKNMPFNIERILIISSADTQGKEIKEGEEQAKWNMDINQYNDIYIQISKSNKAKETDKIEDVTVGNFNIEQMPKLGTVETYRPNNAEDEQLFKYDDKFKIQDLLKFTGGSQNNYSKLTIENQGGRIVFRIANRNVDEYVSNDDGELTINGKLLKEKNIDVNDLKMKISFDLVIHTNTTKYRGKVTLDLPVENLEEEGIGEQTITDFSNVIFKRER